MKYVYVILINIKRYFIYTLNTVQIKNWSIFYLL